MYRIVQRGDVRFLRDRWGVRHSRETHLHLVTVRDSRLLGYFLLIRSFFSCSSLKVGKCEDGGKVS